MGAPQRFQRFIAVTVPVAMILCGCGEPPLPVGFRPGTSWYTIELHGVQAGYASVRSAVGTDDYQLHTQFRLLQGSAGDAQLTRWSIVEEYAQTPPWPLLRRVSETTRGDARERTELQRVAAGRYRRGDGQPMALFYNLTDRLDNRADAADRLEVRLFTDDQPSPVGRVWQVDREPSAATRSAHLDADGTVTELRIGTSLRLRKTSAAVARQIVAPALRTALEVPIDQPLGDPALITTLQLQFPGVDSRGFARNDRQRVGAGDGGTEIIVRGQSRLARNPLPTPLIGTDPVAIGRAARRQLTDPAERAEALVFWTWSQLRWDETVHPLNAADALRLAAGSCVAFGELFAAVATAADLEVRQVFGLAYRGDGHQSLALHAWNDIRLPGKEHWQAVDPTWNLIQVDGTHIALTSQPDDQWRALEQLRNTRGVVRSASNHRSWESAARAAPASAAARPGGNAQP